MVSGPVFLDLMKMRLFPIITGLRTLFHDFSPDLARVLVGCFGTIVRPPISVLPPQAFPSLRHIRDGPQLSRLPQAEPDLRALSCARHAGFELPLDHCR